MSDCSTSAFAVPSCERGILHDPGQPSLRELAEMHGEPPWTLELPWPDALPVEAAEFVGAVVVGGKRFGEVEPC